MTGKTTDHATTPGRSTRPDYTPPDTFTSSEEELLYYKREYQRLKAIIALQKQKIRKLLG